MACNPAVLALSALALLATGCPSDGSGEDAPGTDSVNDGFDDGTDPCAPQIVQSISGNHGHGFDDVELDDVLDEIVLGGRTAGHSHAIKLTPGQIEGLAEGSLVSVETEIGGLHTHQITASVTFPCNNDAFDDGGLPPGDGFPGSGGIPGGTGD